MEDQSRHGRLVPCGFLHICPIPEYSHSNDYAMNGARQRMLNVVAGLTAGLFGIALWAAATYLELVPPAPAGQAPLVEANVVACGTTLSSLGFKSTKVGNELRAERASLENPQQLLNDASLGISACGLPVLRFCMGPGCMSPSLPGGVAFALSTRIHSH
jgi:hypothetical protein